MENVNIFNVNCGTGGVAQRVPLARPSTALASCAAPVLNYKPCLPRVTANSEKQVCSFTEDYCFIQLITDEAEITACGNYEGV